MISFISFQGVPQKYFEDAQLVDWLLICADEYGHAIQRLTYQFCDENTMLEYNRTYLDHDYYTDILTFPESRKTNPVKGDVLINVDRLKDNAAQFNQEIQTELLRLLAHGLLHLCGYTDETIEHKKQMTEEEQYCIRRFDELIKQG